MANSISGLLSQTFSISFSLLSPLTPLTKSG